MDTHCAGTKIRQIRELFGRTQEDIAQKLNITPQAYGRIERGETTISVEKLQQIADTLGLSIQDILKFDDKKLFVTHNNGNNTGEQSSVSFSLTINEAPQEKTVALLEKVIENLHAEVAHLRLQNTNLLALLQQKTDK